MNLFSDLSATRILLVYLLLGGVACAIEKEPDLKVMTFNIRYGTANDGANSWTHRRDLVVERIRAYDADVLGLQEALRMQLDYLGERLPQYSIVGTGRDADGGGEYSAIAFRRERFDVVAAETFWLSDTPDTPGSTSWGNGLPRVCTWIRLFDHHSGQRFNVFNTHWDHRSQPARERSGQAIAKRAGEAALAEGVIVMGDFNAGESNPAITALKEAGLRDTFREIYPDAQEVGTFNDFRNAAGKEKIDGVFVSRHWNVREAEIDRTQSNEQFPSDHFPVTASILLQ